jgi:hypothetical protein
MRSGGNIACIGSAQGRLLLAGDGDITT